MEEVEVIEDFAEIHLPAGKRHTARMAKIGAHEKLPSGQIKV